LLLTLGVLGFAFDAASIALLGWERNRPDASGRNSPARLVRA